MHATAPLLDDEQSTTQHDLPAAHVGVPVHVTMSGLVVLHAYLPVPQHAAPIVGMVAHPPHALLRMLQTNVVPEHVQTPPQLPHAPPSVGGLLEQPPHASTATPLAHPHLSDERHVSGDAHVGQLRSPPHPSDDPHAAPVSAQVFGVHPHTFGVPPPPHVDGAAHAPQSRAPPHESVIVPHFPVQSQTGVHPQTFETPPPPHVSGAVHPPQSCVAPQPSGIEPHFPVQSKLGVHPHTPVVPPPPHVS
jgi:hypothetical protein